MEMRKRADERVRPDHEADGPVRAGRQVRAASSCYSSREEKASIFTNCIAITADTSSRNEGHHTQHDKDFEIRAISEGEE